MRAGLCLSFALLFAHSTAHAFRVEFTPQNEVRRARQVRAIFSEPMVALGSAEQPSPFKIACAPKGRGLWEDPRTWIYEFEKELPAGLRCSFTGEPGLKAKGGSGWEGPASFSFSTGAPVVRQTDPYNGSESVAEDQAFVLTLDGAVDEASLADRVYFLAEGIPERIPAKLAAPAVKQEILKNLRRGYYGSEAEEAGGPKIVVQATRPFPPERKLQLVWGKGVRSSSGLSSTQDQMFAFKTRGPFTANFSCERENAQAPCLPIGSFRLSFSENISSAHASKILLRTGGKARAAKVNKQESVWGVNFEGPFAPNAEYSLELPAGLRDDAGRTLSNAGKFPLKFKTGGYPPLAKFAAPFGVIEAKDAALPVTLRNVEASLPGYRLTGNSLKLDDRDPVALLGWIRQVQERHNSYREWQNEKVIDHRGESLLKGSGGQAWNLPKPGGQQAFEVVGIPLKEKGLHVVEIESQLLGKSLLGAAKPMYVASAALVTDLAVHFKWGKENSLVFVTGLESAEPVGGASVQIVDCAGRELWKGKTERDGVARVDGLPVRSEMKECAGQDRELIVLARKGDDFSLTSSNWNEGIEPWRFQVNFNLEGKENIAHTVLDRTLLRAGQTVHMKHFLRLGFLRGLKASKSFPKSLVIEHASGQRVVQPLRFDANGAAESEWKIPEGAKLGSYEVYLTEKDFAAQPAKANPANEGEDGGEGFYGPGNYRVGEFRVEEFRLPVLTGSLQFPKGPAVAAKELSADLTVRYLNGGGASGLPVNFRARAVERSGITLPAFEGFFFGNGGVALGRQASEEKKGERELKIPAAQLDEGGSARVVVPGLPAFDHPFDLQLEAEYRDPNGAIQTVSRSTQVLPAGLLLGVKTESWLNGKEKVKFQVAAAGPDGKPRAGQAVRVSWVEKKTFSHRKRLVGGFYAYENFRELVARGEACQGKTNSQGILECEVPSLGGGNFLLVAEGEENGRKSFTNRDLWIYAGEDSWVETQNNDRMDLLPEKTHYEPGDTARLQARMPFREATALVTVEREGILEHSVQKLSAKNPVIEVPIKGDFAPNIFVSALVLRGRVGEPQPTALVDLGKPAYKLGIAALSVGWRDHELRVSVESERDEYRVREKARVKVKVKRASDGEGASGGEVLLLAVDEALLELRPNDTWDILRAMMGERPLRVATSTVQGQVVGKRHFGLKALPAGGGGGVGAARELFDTLLLWQAKLLLDKNGEATAEVPMNDSLSSFRLVAIATQGIDRFGTGTKSVRTRQDLMLFSGVAPFARQGDKTCPGITVRNGSDGFLEAELRGRVAGQELSARKVKLAAGASQNAFWNVEIPSSSDQLTYEFEARAGSANDHLKIVQKVEPPYIPTVQQGTLERLDKPLSIQAAPPKGAFPGTSAVQVKVEKKLASNLEGVKEYMARYPYRCLEQQVSRALSQGDEKAWAGIMRALPQYIDGRGLLKYFPEMSSGSEVLSTYILSVADAGGYTLPANQLPSLLEGLKKFVEGRVYPSGFIYPAADLSLRKLGAMDALSRYHVFEPAWLSTIQLDPGTLPLSALVDYRGILAREMNLPKREELLAKVDQAIRARLEFRGTVLGFRSEESERLWWLMGSVDLSAVKLLSGVIQDKAWGNEMGRLVRGVLARQQSGHWDLTTANAWGAVAMRRYTEAYEKEDVAGPTRVLVGGQARELSAGAEGKDSVRLALTAPTPIEVKHEGTGKPWAFLASYAAIERKEPLFKGYRLKRTITPVKQKQKGRWSAGDAYRVSLEVEANSDMTWVAISDPIPAGASLLGSGLGGESSALSQGEKNRGAYPTYVERSFSGYRAYFEWLPKGTTRLDYTVRLNGAGRFRLPNSRVEAMYAPELFAESGNEPVDVAE